MPGKTLSYGKMAVSEPEVGRYQNKDLEDYAFLDADPYCRLNALEVCTTKETSKLCNIQLHFSNCKDVVAYGDQCDQKKEGQQC